MLVDLKTHTRWLFSSSSLISEDDERLVCAILKWSCHHVWHDRDVKGRMWWFREWVKAEPGPNPAVDLWIFVCVCVCVCNPGFIIPVSCCCHCITARDSHTSSTLLTTLDYVLSCLCFSSPGHTSVRKPSGAPGVLDKWQLGVRACLGEDHISN